MCACGIPNQANYHLHAVLTAPFNTSDTDLYLCAVHTPNVPEGTHSARWEPWSFDWLADRVHDLLKFDNASAWEVSEYTLTELR